MVEEKWVVSMELTRAWLPPAFGAAPGLYFHFDLDSGCDVAAAVAV